MTGSLPREKPLQERFATAIAALPYAIQIT